MRVLRDGLFLSNQIAFALYPAKGKYKQTKKDKGYATDFSCPLTERPNPPRFDAFRLQTSLQSGPTLADTLQSSL